MSTCRTNKRTPARATISAAQAGGKSSRGLVLVAATARLGMLGAFIVGSAGGCTTRTPIAPAPAAIQAASERSWSEQLASVRAGKSNEIKLEQAPVSSRELAGLAGLAELRILILDAGVVRNEDASILATLSGLEHLRLRESPLDDRGLAELARGQLDSLIILNLPQATPTAAGLEALGKLPRVRQLRIGGRQIDDAAIDVLAKWPELTSLHLIGPGITEKSLRTIAAMPKLISFYLDDCPLSDSAWEEFFRARPDLHVHLDQAHHDRDPRPDH